ncbi:flagellar hook-associated protein FlgK [Pseudooceanicola sp. HF7]|uniref:flagellar hook-associated protein FlgK n=1 Tax=Pseudooceanicola sp. HF7 TaxID=2721560 RepID=UPI0014306620|nr:flagellar hook-associated protein FlgK [Pseudooceanicola sp. HF7]NIZ10835.1 flagellar hook-associated protein FlgK [Pseudooceanicola sp. HF7]
MSLSGALSNALSGLTMTQRAASVVSSNVANALNDGYGKRELEVSTRGVGSYGGVRIDGVVRYMDDKLVSEWRAAGSALAYTETSATYQNRLESLMGTPEDSSSLAARVARFETSLISAASRPDLPERLTAVLDAAKDMAGEMNDISDGIQTIREEADAEISATVDRTNVLLEQVHDLNGSIRRAINVGDDANSLMDHRQAVIDELSQIMPVLQAGREDGAVALYTPGGAILVDSSPAELGFSRTNTITPHLTRDNGFLSGLTINGQPVETDTFNDPIGGARLASLFEIRDVFAVEAQANLDTVARDLIERFQDAGIDTTRAAGDPGLFTDNGLFFDPADELGISARIAVNAIVDPAQGGETWHLRDGLGAATSGSASDASLIFDMKAALETRRTPTSAVFGTEGLSASGLASSMMSIVSSDRNTADQAMTYANTRTAELKERLLSDGVDTDEEMQRMLLIEQSYSANARLVQTIEEMLDILMRI